MKADHYGTVEKLAKFFEKDLSPEQVQKIVDFTSFSTMKNKKEAKLGESKSSSLQFKLILQGINHKLGPVSS